MFDYILEHFCSDSKFINDLDGVLAYLNSLNLNNDEVAEILNKISDYNEKRYLFMVDENKKLEKIISKSTTNNIGKDLIIPKVELSKQDDNISILEINVKKYVDEIKNSKSCDEIKNILPNKGSLNYSSTINLIILGLYEDIFVYRKLLAMDRMNISAEELKNIKKEIETLQIKIDYIKRLNQNTHIVINNKDDSINTLLFLKTASGNYSIYSDLKEIACEHYYLFHRLLTSLIKDKPMNFKRFSDNDIIQGLMEVRYNQARVTYMPVSKNKYVILDMFIKKTQVDAGYQAALKNKCDLFKDNQPVILNLMSNDEYLEENKRVLNNLLSTLEHDSRVKKLGGYNE